VGTSLAILCGRRGCFTRVGQGQIFINFLLFYRRGCFGGIIGILAKG
jgi:hypothetical protein